MTTSAHSSYDIVIVGGGMVGTSLACALRRTCRDYGLSCLLLESAKVDPDTAPVQPGYDSRSTALSAGSVSYLKSLSLWSEMQGYACPIEKIHVSDRGHFGAVRLSSKDYPVEALGFVIENVHCGQVLNRVLAGAGDVEVNDNTRVEKLVPTPKGMELILNRKGEVRAISSTLVVLAEGGRSGLSETIGIERCETRYEQTAVIANVSFSAGHGNVAYERFTSAGPLALLPLPSFAGMNRAALVWTHSHQDAAGIMALSDDEFLSRLQQAFGNRLGEFFRVGARACFPLGLVRAREQYRRGLVLLGNVAQSLHPVAGQGFNLALRNTMMLAETLAQACAEEQPLGSMEVLGRYAERIAGDQGVTIAFSDYMTRLFSSDSTAKVWIRKFGLFSFDLVPPLKQALVMQAMGRNSPLVRV